MNKNTVFLASLNTFSKFGPVRLKKIKNYFPDWETAFGAGVKDFMQAGIEENVAMEFISARFSIHPEEIGDRIEKENIKIIDIDDESYPKKLKDIFNPPQIFYIKGSLDAGDDFGIAIVGTRKFSPYGKQVTEDIVSKLARENFTIISGLALGIDAIAHNATLQEKGRTIGILGSGVDKQSIYPASNRYLAEKIIASGGAIVSEFPLGTSPLPFHFPQRNRIIAGLSRATVVIEAGEKSGALITAYYALEYGREIFSVPGSIYSPVSAGTNKLIKEGARPIHSANDIIEGLDLVRISSFIENKKIIADTPEEELVLQHLTREPLHINDIIRVTGLDTAAINSTLTIMEMKGMIKNLGAMKYVLAK